MPKARSKNKFIRTYSLSRQCLERLSLHAQPWENKSYTVERLLMAQMDFIEGCKARKYQGSSAGQTPVNPQPQQVKRVPEIDPDTGLPVIYQD